MPHGEPAAAFAVTVSVRAPEDQAFDKSEDAHGITRIGGRVSHAGQYQRRATVSGVAEAPHHVAGSIRPPCQVCRHDGHSRYTSICRDPPEKG